MHHKLGRLTLSEEDRRVLAGWAAACAERTLPLFETEAPGDEDPERPLKVRAPSLMTSCGLERPAPFR